MESGVQLGLEEAEEEEEEENWMTVSADGAI